MLTFCEGDLFLSDAQTFGQGVNARGIMGAGIAVEFKRRYPDMFHEYHDLCTSGDLLPGDFHIYSAPDHKILNLVTQDGLNGAQIEHVHTALRRFARHHHRYHIVSLAIPRIASGLGGLDWTEVKAAIIAHWASLPIDIQVFETFVKDQAPTPIT